MSKKGMEREDLPNGDVLLPRLWINRCEENEYQTIQIEQKHKYHPV